MKHVYRFLAILIVVATVLSVLPAGSLAAPGDNTLVSRATDGYQGNDASERPFIAGGGRNVAFESFATSLVAGDTNEMTDIFVHDLTTGVTRRASVATDGTEANGASYKPSVSYDGRYVAFTSYATNLVTGDTNGGSDVFVHDLTTGITTRVSVATGGTQANYNATEGFISANGRYVVFGSYATNLVSGDTNGKGDIFVHDRDTNTTMRVSVATGGGQANEESFAPSISADGRYVAFSSVATNLASGDLNGAYDIFVHDRDTGNTTLVSVASDGTRADGESNPAYISGDGCHVAFLSYATNLVSGDTNGRADLFVHDCEDGSTTRVSVATDGTQAITKSEEEFSISFGGEFVVFASTSTNLVIPDENHTYDVFLRDIPNGTTSFVSAGPTGIQGNSYSLAPSISADGSYVAFQSDATNLAIGDSNLYEDVFVHEMDYGFPAVSFGVESVPPSEGAELTTAPSTLLVQFNRIVRSDGSPEAANSLTNYMLLRRGANDTFDTTGASTAICDPAHVPEGDDERIDIASITYDPSTFRATITIDPASAPLPNGQYRLYLCGAASIRDRRGIPLNGGFNSAINFTVTGTATITLDNLIHEYDGTPKSATATTDPPGLPVTFTYNDSSIPPTTVGTYALVATVDDPNYEGTANGTFVIQDTTPPVVTSFVVPASSATLDIPITEFSASDLNGVNDYLISESAAQPPADDTGWNSTAPATYSVTTAGSHTLYPWARDHAGNVSAVFGSPRTVLICLPTVVVTNANDSGPGSLRQAIHDACPDGTITFDNDYAILLGGPLTLDKNMTIDGAGHTLSISGENAYQVFSVNGGVTATLQHLTITRGRGSFGGGISNNGTLTVTDSIFLSNKAAWGGGVWNAGNLTIANTTFDSNSTEAFSGAGIFNNQGTLTVRSSTFVNNHALSDGGAIYSNHATVTITNSTFTRNWANQYGGGIYNYNNSTLSLYNDTFSNNRGDAGGADITNRAATLHYANTIMANPLTGVNCYLMDAGVIGTNVNNLVESSTGCGTPALSTDLNLTAALAANGGSTRTMALLPGSPAIDAGSDAACAAVPVSNLDQRGVARSQGAHCDIGAFESQGFTFGNLTGTPQSAAINTAFTSPLGLTVMANNPNEPVNGGQITFTATGSGASAVLSRSTAMIAGGTTSVTATANGVAGGPYNVIASARGATSVNFALTNTKGAATVVLDDQIQEYDGELHPVIVTTNPPGLAVNVTYDGSSTPPRNAGDYAVVATVVDPNYEGSISSDLSVSPRPIAVAAVMNSKVYDGTTASSGVPTISEGSLVGSDTATWTQTFDTANAGTGKILTPSGTVSDGNGGSNYAVTFIPTNTGVITKAVATVVLSNLTQEYDGTPKSATATTNPAGLTVTFLYNAQPALPVNVGNYAVAATVVDENYQGEANGTFTIQITVVPTVTSVVRQNTSPSNRSTVFFLVTFSEPVTGVNAADFALVTTGDLTSASIASVTGSGTTRTVAVNTGTGSGSLRLDVLDDNTILNATGNSLGGAFTGGQEYAIDRSAPTVVSSTRLNTSPTNRSAVFFLVTFSESVMGVGSADFALTTTGNLEGASIASVTGSGTTRTVAVNTGTGSGSLRLDVLDDDTIKDAVGNPLSGLFTSGEEYTLDRIAPTVVSSTRLNTNPTNRSTVFFVVTFSEPVIGVGVADFTLTATGISGASIVSVSGSGATRTVAVNTGTGSGDLRLDVLYDDTIKDAAGNALNGAFTTGQSYTIVR